MRLNRCSIWALAALAGLFRLSLLDAASITSISFNQVDGYNNGALVAPRTNWGEFDVSYTQDPFSNQWLNVVQTGGSGGPRWVVQNHPLISAALTGTPTFDSNSYFDFGVPSGTDVTGTTFSYFYTISSTPATSTPLSGVSSSTTVGLTQNILNSGVPSGVGTVGSPGTGINWNVPFVPPVVTWHGGMPNVVQELNWCGPGAAANSLHWLSGTFGFPIDQTLLQSQTELAADMNNTHIGNWDGAEVSGKLKYIKDHNLPLDVHYVGGETLPTKGNYVDPNGNGTATNDGAITWDWIQSEMAKGQDVELVTPRHWVVIEGTISFDGIHLFSYRDDRFQHGAATTAAEKAELAKRHTWTYFTDTGHTAITLAGDERVAAVVAESVPEPATAGLLIAGLSLFASAAKRKLRGSSHIQPKTSVKDFGPSFPERFEFDPS